MADDSGIKVVISPSTITGGGKRLAEMSPSFASDKFGGPRFTAPGTDQRSAINVEKKLIDVQTALVGEIKQLRKTMQGTAPGTAERTALQSRINDLLAQQKRTLAGASELGAIAKERALTSRTGAAIMPSSRVGARALFGHAQGIGGSLLAAAGAAWAGDPLAAGRHAFAGTYAASRYLAGGGAAEGVAAEGAEAAGGIGLGPILAAGGAAAALGLGYEAYRHPDIARGIIGAPLAIHQARKYGPTEAMRQITAYRAARAFGESGQSIIGATTGQPWTGLGIDAATATGALTQARTISGAEALSNRGAQRGIAAGVYSGMTPEESAITTGSLARLGSQNPSAAIKIVAAGVQMAGQSGLQHEVLRAELEYFRAQAQRVTIPDMNRAVTGMAAVASVLQSTGAAAFRGAGAVSTISGITRAFNPDNIIPVAPIGQALTMEGQASIIQATATARHLTGRTDQEVAKLSASDRLEIARRIQLRAFLNTGPDRAIFMGGLSASIRNARAGGLLTMGAEERAWGLPEGREGDLALTNMQRYADTGNWEALVKERDAHLIAKAPRQIPPIAQALARKSHAEALTGEASMRTYRAITDFETALIDRMRIKPETDQAVAKLITRAAVAVEPGTHRSGLIAALSGFGGEATGGIGPGFTTPPAAPPTAVPGMPVTRPGSTLDATMGNVGDRIVAAIETLTSAILNHGMLPPPAFGAPGAPAYAPASLPPSHPAATPPSHGAVVPPGSHHR